MASTYDTQDDWTIDGSTVTSVGTSGGLVDKPGMYQFEVVAAHKEFNPVNPKTGKEQTPHVRLDLVVMNDVKGQSRPGAQLFHRINFRTKDGEPLSEGAVKGIFRFLLGLGVLTDRGEQESPRYVRRDNGTAKLDAKLFESLIGKHFIAKVELEKGNGDYKDQYRISWNETYTLDDPAVKDVPKNLAAAGRTPPPPAATAPQSPATEVDLSDL